MYMIKPGKWYRRVRGHHVYMRIFIRRMKTPTIFVKRTYVEY